MSRARDAQELLTCPLQDCRERAAELVRIAADAGRLRETLREIVKDTEGELEMDVRWVHDAARAALEASYRSHA